MALKHREVQQAPCRIQLALCTRRLRLAQPVHLSSHLVYVHCHTAASHLQEE